MGVWVSVITGRWSRNISKREYLENVRVYRNLTLGSSWKSGLMRHFSGFMYMVSLAWFLLTEGKRYDVFHVHQAFYPAYVTVLIGRLLHKPVIVKIGVGGKINDLLLMKSGRYPLGEWMLKTILKADMFVAISPQIQQELAELNVSEEKIVSIPNGVAIPNTGKSDYKLHKPVKIVFVGRLNPEKRCDLLIETVEAVYREISVRCDIFGDGPLRQSLRKMIHTKGIESVVSLKGYKKSLREFLTEYDLFVLPSEAEGMSNALLEAMACGLPCIVSDIPPNRELVATDEKEDELGEVGYVVGRCGVLFRSGDSKGLSEAIRFLYGNDEVRRKIGEEARARVIERFSMKYVAEQYVMLYKIFVRR